LIPAGGQSCRGPLIRNRKTHTPARRKTIEHYSTAGVCDARPEIVRLDEITDRVLVVRVHWPWLDDQGNALGAECSTYTLRRDSAGDWRIRTAIMHGVEALN